MSPKGGIVSERFCDLRHQPRRRAPMNIYVWWAIPPFGLRPFSSVTHGLRAWA